MVEGMLWAHEGGSSSLSFRTVWLMVISYWLSVYSTNNQLPITDNQKSRCGEVGESQMTVNHLLRLSRFESYQRHKLENKSARCGDRLLNDWVGENLAVVRVHCFPLLWFLGNWLSEIGLTNPY
jgi:hypothetical protein